MWQGARSPRERCFNCLTLLLASANIVTISYSFTDLLRKIHYFNSRQSTLDVTLSCDNLFTITNYSGIDPEVGGVGLDCGQYPISRTISLGVKLKF